MAERSSRPGSRGGTRAKRRAPHEPAPAVKPAAEEPGARLKRFMVGLASDVGRLGAFMSDAKAAMAQAGLTQEEQELLLSGDQARIYSALKGLPPPPPSPAPGPLQLPTVVASMFGQQPSAAAAPKPSVAPGPSAQAPAAPVQPAPPAGQAQASQLPLYYVALPQGYATMPAYYVLQWPGWPTG